MLFHSMGSAVPEYAAVSVWGLGHVLMILAFPLPTWVLGPLGIRLRLGVLPPHGPLAFSRVKPYKGRGPFKMIVS